MSAAIDADLLRAYALLVGVALHRDCSRLEIQIATLLIELSRTRGIVAISQPEISQRIGRSRYGNEEAISSALRTLCRLGFIEVERQHSGRRPTTYRPRYEAGAPGVYRNVLSDAQSEGAPS